ncbi:MAG: hypothetical protein IPK00_24180 [Deltaproteobacteria bacterium]|nr:hypothetical protein [Deltaproteobacteria bacterium]
MSLLVEIALVALVGALWRSCSGRSWRSVLAGHAAMAALRAPFLAAGAECSRSASCLFGLVWLAILQLFGWMLVDVDRDHLAAPARRTIAAPSPALTIFRGGPRLIARRALAPDSSTTASAGGHGPAIDPTALGRLSFSRAGNGSALLVGILLAAGLLTALWLLRDEGREAG